MGEARRRLRSVIGGKGDPDAGNIQTVIDTLEGKNNPPRRELPGLTVDRAMKTILAAAAREKCLLCQSEPYGVGVFVVPEALRRIGQKVVLYTLCFSCKADVASKGKVEKRLVVGLQAENAKAVAV